MRILNAPSNTTYKSPPPPTPLLPPQPTATMPVTFKVASHPAVPITRRDIDTTSPEAILKGAAHNCAQHCGEVFQSSVKDADIPHVVPSPNGFVYACIQAYNQHQNLVIRPDDVWMCILTQFSMYVNKHAEEMRSYFVDHQGRKELEVRAVGTRYTADLQKISNRMGELLDVCLFISLD